ncbi:hypothetical protein TrLO_g7768 [Triparma laevis f. longispina]|uniref:Uncharacterized protein n=1 Tax=Triparma laevis f. longispina TaxID=1714387 RepID=A0A9W7FFR7_9STRA|nr:hypothetical protein TrLO_g7768 [Triparma laevis f. longispina]
MDDRSDRSRTPLGTWRTSSEMLAQLRMEGAVLSREYFVRPFATFFSVIPLVIGVCACSAALLLNLSQGCAQIVLQERRPSAPKPRPDVEG